MQGKKEILYNFRPPLLPITEEFALEFMKEKNLSNQDKQILKEIRKMIAKDHFRFFMWADLLEKYGGLESIDTKRRIEYAYKLNSIVYQSFYGES